MHVQDDLAKDIVSIKEKGEELSNQCIKERLTTIEKSFNGSTISQNKTKLFKNTGKIVKVDKNNKTRVLEVNRNIMGALLSFSAKTETAIDMEKALEYPLSPAPLSIAHPDGTRCTTQKKDLLDIIKNHHKSSNIPPPTSLLKSIP